jgi:hypothetical protein
MFRRYLMGWMISGIVAIALVASAVAPGKSQNPPTLAEQRLKVAQQASDAIKALRKTRRNVSSEQVYRWSLRLMEAEKGMSNKTADEIAAVNAHLLRMKEMEQRLSQAYHQWEAGHLDALEAQWYVLEAELLLSQAQGEHAER